MKPKLHYISLFSTWEFPERAPLSNIFPIHSSAHSVELLWVFKMPKCPARQKNTSQPQSCNNMVLCKCSPDFEWALCLPIGSSPMRQHTKRSLYQRDVHSSRWPEDQTGGPAWCFTSVCLPATKIQCIC